MLRPHCWDDFQARSSNRNHFLTKRLHQVKYVCMEDTTLTVHTLLCRPARQHALIWNQRVTHVSAIPSLTDSFSWLDPKQIYCSVFFFFTMLSSSKLLHQLEPFQLVQPADALLVFALKTLLWRPTWALMLICEEKYTSRAWLTFIWLRKKFKFSTDKSLLTSTVPSETEWRSWV